MNWVEDSPSLDERAEQLADKLGIDKAAAMRLIADLAKPGKAMIVPEPPQVSYVVRILGDPMPWERAGARIAGKPPKQWIVFYPPKRTEKAEAAVGAAWRAAGHGHWPKGSRLLIVCTFAFARPLFHCGTGRNAGVVKPQYLSTRPGKGGGQRKGQPRTGADVDNLVKLVKDGLSGIAYVDDGDVVRVEAEKLFVDQAAVAEPQTIIELRAM